MFIGAAVIIWFLYQSDSVKEALDIYQCKVHENGPDPKNYQFISLLGNVQKKYEWPFSSLHQVRDPVRIYTEIMSSSLYMFCQAAKQQFAIKCPQTDLRKKKVRQDYLNCWGYSVYLDYEKKSGVRAEPWRTPHFNRTTEDYDFIATRERTLRSAQVSRWTILS